MQIEVTPEVLLAQLGYPKSEQTLQQVKKAIDNTNGFDKFDKHIIQLHNELTRIKEIV